LGVVFFVAVFLVAVAFFAVFVAGAFVFVTRPDLVLLSTVGASSTAGAGAVFRGLLALALGLAAAFLAGAFAVAVFFVVVVAAFLGPGFVAVFYDSVSA